MMKKKVAIISALAILILVGSNLLTYFLNDRNEESPINYDFFILQPVYIFEGKIYSESNSTILSNSTRISLLQRTYINNQSSGNITGFSASIFIYTENKPITLEVTWGFSRMNLSGFLQPIFFGSGSIEIIYSENLPMLYILTHREFHQLGYIDVLNFIYLSANITISIV